MFKCAANLLRTDPASEIAPDSFAGKSVVDNEVPRFSMHVYCLKSPLNRSDGANIRPKDLLYVRKELSIKGLRTDLDPRVLRSRTGDQPVCASERRIRKVRRPDGLSLNLAQSARYGRRYTLEFSLADLAARCYRGNLHRQWTRLRDGFNEPLHATRGDDLALDVAKESHDFVEPLDETPERKVWGVQLPGDCGTLDKFVWVWHG